MALHKEDAHIAFILVMESPSSTLNPFARTVVPILDDECYVETNYRRLLYISINIVIAWWYSHITASWSSPGHILRSETSIGLCARSNTFWRVNHVLSPYSVFMTEYHRPLQWQAETNWFRLALVFWNDRRSRGWTETVHTLSLSFDCHVVICEKESYASLRRDILTFEAWKRFSLSWEANFMISWLSLVFRTQAELDSYK